MSEINERNEFLLEILVEELPTTEVDGLISQLQEKVETLLKNENIKYEKIETFIAPRRFGFVITGLPDSTPDKLIEKKGPAINVAFDENKQPTKALLGFLKSNNSCLDEVKIVENYVYILKVQRGIKIDEFLKNNVPGMITSLRFRKPMRWGNGKYEFVRIPHNVFAIYNGKTIDMKIFDIPATNKTVGHRFVMDEYFEVHSAEEYFSKLREYYVIAKLEDRIEFIKAQLDEFEKSGFQVDKDHELIKEVAILTEYPKLITGTFDEKFLNLPQELIKTTIKHHQRSFTVQKEGNITNIFIAFIDMP
ncbi:MAG: glycine--tRNA ligase subunit beta, partial [Fervidobacterium sp.]